jgi:hypothetical protein
VREKYCWLVADKPSEQGEGFVSVQLSRWSHLPTDALFSLVYIFPLGGSGIIHTSGVLTQFVLPNSPSIQVYQHWKQVIKV